MKVIIEALRAYATEVSTLSAKNTTTEGSYYPALKELTSVILRHLGLPADVRVNTSERRFGGGSDQPDVALYDGGGDFAIVCGEVKLPSASIADMGISTERNDQIGRYLAQTGVMLLSNVRGIGILAVRPGFTGDGAVPPDQRELVDHVELWPSLSGFSSGEPIAADRAEPLVALIEEAVTSFAPIAEPESLARVLAVQARRAKKSLPESFGTAVGTLAEDFGEALGISFEGEEGEEFFRSSLVQTIYYGLFAGWLLWARKRRTEDDLPPFDWRTIPSQLKIPFLGELFYEIQHPRRIQALGLAPRLDSAAETLRRVNQDRFFERLRLPSFGSDGDDIGTATATAIVYFYEPFLETFDPDLRKELGVWYTPPEIVRYQVRRVDQLLRSEVGLDRGLADESVVILDPACGTGAYLIETLATIAEQLREEGISAELGETLLRATKERVLGFEILTAPFVVAHLQLHLILSSLGGEPGSDDRVGVFLTNSLTGWHDGDEQVKLHFPELQAEHDAAHAIKTKKRIIVILGNPPYNRFAGAPIEEERDLVDPYKGIRRDPKGRQIGNTALYGDWGIRKHLLDDLYIRFFRLAEERIGVEAEHGIVSYISNNSYLGGRSHPIMRESLLTHFHDVWIDNLHGNRLANERTPEGDSCQTIFSVKGGGPGIKVGTAITTLVKLKESPSQPENTGIRIRDFWGEAGDKRAALVQSLSDGSHPYSESFTSSRERRWKLIPYEASGGYEDWIAVDEIFKESIQGVNPNRGLSGSLIEIEREALEDRMREYFDDQKRFRTIATRHPMVAENRAGYVAKETRTELLKEAGFEADRIVPYALFPLDGRYIYYETRQNLLNRSRPDLWRNLPQNEFLIAVPQPRRPSEAKPLYASTAFDLHLHDRGSVGFPAVFRPEVTEGDLFASADHSAPRANLTAEIWDLLAGEWQITPEVTGEDALDIARGLVHVVLAIGLSPEYQDDHRDSLLHGGWARFPLPRDRQLFAQLRAAGQQAAILLDPFSDPREFIHELIGREAAASLAVLSSSEGQPVRENDLRVDISYFGAARGRWVPEHDDDGSAWATSTGDLFINDTVYFANVPEEVWRMELGGYPVIKKWLGYRHERYRDGRPLSLKEKDEFRQVVQRLAALHALGSSLNLLYESAAADCFHLEAE